MKYVRISKKRFFKNPTYRPNSFRHVTGNEGFGVFLAQRMILANKLIIDIDVQYTGDVVFVYIVKQ